MAGPWKDARGIIVTTTPTIEGRPIQDYLGIVTGEVIVGANLFRDLFANIRDIVGGRSGSYERILADARKQAIWDVTLDIKVVFTAIGFSTMVGVFFKMQAHIRAIRMLQQTQRGFGRNGCVRGPLQTAHRKRQQQGIAQYHTCAPIFDHTL